MRNILKYISFLILLICQVYAYSQTTQVSPAPLVGDPQFESVIDSYLSRSVEIMTVDSLSNITQDVLVLDARELEEYNVSHIPSAKYFGYDDPDFSVLKNIESNTRIVVYCSIGYRSEKMGEKLKSMGFNNVYNLYGSIFEWANKNLSLENNAGEPTNKIHGYNKNWSKWISNENAEVTY